MATEFTITADSSPVYDGWGWADYWSCDDWIFWHKELKKKFGADEAKRQWLNAWKQHGLGSALTGLGGCGYQSGFVDYVSKEGLDDSISWLGAVVSGGGKVIGEVGNAAGDIVENVGDAAGNTAGVLKWAVPLLVTVLVIGIIYIIYQSAKSGKLAFKP